MAAILSALVSKLGLCITAIERALQSESRLSPRLIRLWRKWTCALGRPFDFAQGRLCKLSFWSERLRKNGSTEASTKHGIEPVRLCAALFQAHLSIDTLSSFPLTVNNAG
jgi:hypothetical protein